MMSSCLSHFGSYSIKLEPRFARTATDSIFSAHQDLRVVVTSVLPPVEHAARTPMATTLPALLGTHAAAVRVQLQGISAAPIRWATNIPWLQAQSVQLISTRVFSAGTVMVSRLCAVKAPHAVETSASHRAARVVKTPWETTLYAQRIIRAVGTPAPHPTASAAPTVRATSML